MRRTPLALLVVATGCNWVFGLQQTRPLDGPPDSPDGPPDAPFVRMLFERQVGTTDTSGMAIQGMSAAISPAPVIQLGAMGGALQPAAYDDATHTFIVPFLLPGNPWRLVYTVDADPTPTEIQWTANSAHLMLPWLARPGDPPPPAGSGWDFKVQGSNPGIAAPRVMTSGAFTETSVPIADLAGPAEVTYQYAQYAQGILGPVGTPTVAQGDWALLYDFRYYSGSIPNTIVKTIGYSWAQADLAPGSLTTVMPAWTTTVTTISGLNWQDLINNPRFAAQTTLGSCCRYHLEYGILPSPYIAPFLPSPTGIDTTSLVQEYVQDDTAGANSILVIEPPASQVKLPRAYLAEYQSTRTVNGVQLISTLQSFGTSKTFLFTAPMAESVQFGGVSLKNGGDNQKIPASTSTIALQWNVEPSGANPLVADDWVVTLYDLTSGTLAPVRRYQVLSPRVDVDGTLLMTGHQYVFGITAREGFPNAAQADYSKVTLPFAETTVYPLSFSLQ